MSAWEKFLATVLAIATENGVRYLIFAGLGWLLGYVLFRRRWAHRKIIQKSPERADIRRELALSMMTVCIYGVVGAVTLWAWKRHGFGQMYTRLDQHGMVWFWCSLPLVILLHDTYFYWTHRWMHRPRWFRWFHRAHHRSMNPSPWASYSFDPLEAVVQACIFPLAILVMPIHPLVFMMFMIWQITFNVIGHTGYEIWPRWMMDFWLGKLMNTPTNHIMHHEFVRGNYGLYFNVWDRLMRTNHPDYEKRFRKVTSGKGAVLQPSTDGPTILDASSEGLPTS